jgi:predicted nucleic acid-binding protein
MRAGIDTNILIYASLPREGQKYAIARSVLEYTSLPGRGILALQALTEFYAVATRKAYSTPAQAWAYVQAWSDVIPVEPAGPSDFTVAAHLHQDHNIAFWDAMMIATYQRAGARTFISEDLQNGRTFGELRVLNPFAAESGSTSGPFGLHEDPKAWQRS